MFKNNHLPIVRLNRKGAFFSLILMLNWLLLFNCTTEEKKDVANSPADSVSKAISTPEQEEEKPALTASKIIYYEGAADDPIKKALETFSPFTLVHSLASRSIQVKDSLEVIRETQKLTEPADSLVFMPYETRAHQAILDYQHWMASGAALPDKCPNLIQLDRSTEANDSTHYILPTAGPSQFLSQSDFFFLGGAPFLTKLSPEDNAVFTDSQGNPETHFESDNTENGNYLLNSLYHFKPGPVAVTFGPPLDSYDSGPQDVKGIGSLIHTFEKPIPAFFLTEAGVVPARVVSVTLKLVPEDLGCRSDQPRIRLACSKNLEEEEILGIYIPYNAKTLTSCTIIRPNNTLWTADINGDGVADLAAVSEKFEGNIDTLAEVLWFVNINGTWKVIDWGQDLDCT